jgi:hypothetical protein
MTLNLNFTVIMNSVKHFSHFIHYFWHAVSKINKDKVFYHLFFKHVFVGVGANKRGNHKVNTTEEPEADRLIKLMCQRLVNNPKEIG